MLTIILASIIGIAIPKEDPAACRFRVAEELEVSGESAADIAKAAVTACISVEGWAEAPPNSLYKSLPPHKRIELVEDQRNMASADIQLAIVRYRACKRTLNCSTQGGLAGFK